MPMASFAAPHPAGKDQVNYTEKHSSLLFASGSTQIPTSATNRDVLVLDVNFSMN